MKTNEQADSSDNEIKTVCLMCLDLLRDVDLYGDISMPKKTVEECSNIASNGLKRIMEDYPEIISKCMVIRKETGPIKGYEYNEIEPDRFPETLTEDQLKYYNEVSAALKRDYEEKMWLLRQKIMSDKDGG